MFAELGKTYVSSRGQECKQLFQKIPALRFVYTAAEAEYDVLPVKDWVANNWAVPVGFVVVYLVGIAAGTQYMKNVPYKNRLASQLAYWNAFLCLFSTLGALRTVPHLLNLIATTTFEETVCTPPDVEWGVGATGLWVQLFILSKIPEVGAVCHPSVGFLAPSCSLSLTNSPSLPLQHDVCALRRRVSSGTPSTS